MTAMRKASIIALLKGIETGEAAVTQVVNEAVYVPAQSTDP